MKLETTTLMPEGWVMPELRPELEGLAGADEFAVVLQHARRYLDDPRLTTMAPLSDAGLGSLVRLAYHAGLLQEEGQAVNVRIVCRERSARDVLQLTAPLELVSPNVIRRVAALAGPDQALLVEERLGHLHIVGVTAIHETITDLDQPSGSTGRGPSLELAVKAPGWLVAREPLVGFELRGGKVHELGPFTRLASISSLRAELADSLRGALRAEGGEDAARMFGGNIGPVAMSVLTGAVALAEHGGRGGAFLIPPGVGRVPPDVTIKYAAAAPDAADAVTGYWQACMDAVLAQQSERKRALRLVAMAKAHLAHVANSLGGASFVDGCVVVSRRLELCGFGGEISGLHREARRSEVVFRNYQTGEEAPYQEVMQAFPGTRHRSAIRYCYAHPGAIAIVVSQDRAVRVFSSDQKHLRGHEHLTADWPIHSVS